MPYPNAALTEVPSAWSAYLPILTGLFRTILAAIGAVGFTWASAVTGSQIEMAAGAAMMLGAAVWSAVQKIRAIRASRRMVVSAAVQSAHATQQAGELRAVIPSSPVGTTSADLNRVELDRIQQDGRPLA